MAIVVLKRAHFARRPLGLQLQIQRIEKSRKQPSAARCPRPFGRPRAADPTTGAVVETSRVTVAEVWPVGFNVTEEALKLHVLSSGKPVHNDDDSGIVPLYPFNPVIVSTVDPVEPGLLTITVAGLPETVNVGDRVTVSVNVPEEGA